MTKTAVAVATACFLLLATPTAMAHGAAEPREIDTRILADDDGLSGYGICFEGQCVPGSSPQGWDIVVLEGREAALATGEPVLILRTVVQAADVQDGRGIDITFKAGGKDHTFGFVAAGAGVTTTTFDAIEGPMDAFDGYPKAVDGYILYSTLGVKAGDAITDIRVTSTYEAEPADIAPGTWFLMGEEVPASAAEHPAGEYTLKGPASLVNVTADKLEADASRAPANVTFQVANALSATAQFATLNLTVPAGITASLDQAGLNLEPGSKRTVTLSIANASASGTVFLTVTSDTGAYERLEIPVTGIVTATVDEGHHGGAGTSGSGEEHHEDDETGQEAPGASLVLSLIVLAAAAFVMRRKV